MAKVVVDASVILAMVRGELGWERTVEALPEAVISSVNAAEVFAKIVDWNLPRAEHLKVHAMLEPIIVPFHVDLAIRSGKLRGVTRAHGLSMADRACLALAQRLTLPVLTSDQVWSELALGIEVELIR